MIFFWCYRFPTLYFKKLFKAHQYLADANEAESWMREKEPVVGSTDYGKDEDSAESLLKKHRALMSDLEAFKSTIDVRRNFEFKIYNKY